MTISTDDNFSAAFDELAKLGDKEPEGAAPAAAEAPVPVEGEGADPASDAGTGEGSPPAAEAQPEDAGEGGAAPSGEGAAEGAAGGGVAPAPEAKAGEPSDEELLARLAKMVNAAPAKPSEKSGEPEPAPAPVAAEEPAPELYNEEEKALLTAYEKDWPDVAKAEQLRRRAEYRDLTQYMFQSIAKEIKPYLEMVQVLAEQSQHSDITSRVQDYDDIREKVIDWVGQQPAYLQAAYKQVIKTGTSEEVVDLIDRYRKDVGASATPTPPAVPAKEPELSTAAKQAAAALAPVSSKRSVVPQGEDPNNFDDAFARFSTGNL